MGPRTNAATVYRERRHHGRRTAQRAYLALHPHLLAAHDGGAPPQPQMLVGAVAPDGEVRTTRLSEGEFLVVGRHTRCGLQLPDDDISLRHILLRWTRDEQGRPLIRLWDLRAGRPFVTEDEHETGALVAEELLFGAIGAHTLAMVPLGGQAPLSNAEFAWHSLPERRFEIVGAAHQRSRARDSITVSHTQPPMVFGEGGLVPEGEVAGRIEVELPGGRTERVLTDAQLDRGLLFGRYERCQLTLSGEDRLSRVHLFVGRVGDALWAVDTASTHGTHRNGSPVAAVPLTGAMSLLLASHCVVRWHPRSTSALA